METVEYDKAYKIGKREMSARKARGLSPFLEVLDEIPGAASSVMEYPLGLVQIPTEQIVGTKTEGRSNAFAHNFMPVLDSGSEFARKWEELCASHLEEGIRDPIKAYEYMNKFYVLEGNKRVSVLKYFDAVSVPGYVTRIIPYRTEEKENQIYYEFMDFYSLSQINYVSFTEKGRFAKLQLLVGKKPDETWDDDDRMEFNSAFVTFSNAYRQVKTSEAEGITDGDAFLEFVEIYGYQAVKDMTAAELKKNIQKTSKVFKTISKEENLELVMDPEEGKKTILKRLMGTGVKKIAFVHEVDPDKSGWTYAHELGRMHAEQIFGKQIIVKRYIGKEYQSYEDAIEQAIQDGNTIIFTTSPVLYRASLKKAIDNPNVKILNCSLMAEKGVIRNYNARMYEAKFLIGAIAGALTETGKVGYVADYPIYGTIANANAFALGARMVNPRVEVHLEWLAQKSGNQLMEEFKSRGIDLISGRDIIVPGSDVGSRHFGLFWTCEQSARNIAMPIWNWGKFYEETIRNIMNGAWKNEEASGKALNYWWGMSSGMIDVVCSHNLPEGTKRLVWLLKKTICNGEFNPFSGVIYSQNGIIQGKENETLTAEKIITMDWLCDNIVGTIPSVNEVSDHAKAVVQEQGVQTKK